MGPSTSAVGGIGSVIGTYTSAPDTQFDHRAIATYRADSLLASIGGLIHTLVRLSQLKLQRRPVLLHAHLSQGGAFLREGVLLIAASALRVPTVASLHGSRFVQFAKTNPRLTAFVLRRARVITVLSTPTRGVVEALVTKHQLVVALGNPVAFPEQVTAPPASPVVLFAGEVGRRKGADTLLAAWPAVIHKIPEARLIIAGPPATDATDLVRDLSGLEGCTLLGSVAPDEVARFIERSRLCVLPSRAEALPRFLLEAMAHGRPVVGTSVGGVPDIVDDAVGALIESSSPTALADAIVSILATSDSAQRKGEEARRRVAQYDVHAHVAVLEQRYADLLG